MIQIGGVYTTFCQEEDILLQKCRDSIGACIAILFKKYQGLTLQMCMARGRLTLYKGTQGVRARYSAELPPIISIVRYPGRPYEMLLGSLNHDMFKPFRAHRCLFG